LPLADSEWVALNLPKGDKPMQTTYQKSARKLLLIGVAALVLFAAAISAYANSLRMIATSDDGSFTAVSCGSSAGNFRVVYAASTGEYTFLPPEDGDCPTYAY
jgi:hypothetical protein